MKYGDCSLQLSSKHGKWKESSDTVLRLSERSSCNLESILIKSGWWLEQEWRNCIMITFQWLLSCSRNSLDPHFPWMILNCLCCLCIETKVLYHCKENSILILMHQRPEAVVMSVLGSNTKIIISWKFVSVFEKGSFDVFLALAEELRLKALAGLSAETNSEFRNKIILPKNIISQFQREN